RRILIGPRAQAILQPYLGKEQDAYCFSPAESERRRSVARRAKRRTPVWPSHAKHQAQKRKARRERSPTDRYDTHSYRRAIHRACDRAAAPPEHLCRRSLENGKRESAADFAARMTDEHKEELKRWQKAHRWHPNRLRHAAATLIRARYGLEASQVI